MFYSPIEQFDLIPSNFIYIYTFCNFTNIIFFLIFSYFFLFFFIRYLFIWKLIPNKLQLIFEYFINFVFDLLISITGIKGRASFPFILTLFIFFLFTNYSGLAPYSFSASCYGGISFTISLTLWFNFIFLGFIMHQLKFLCLFTPAVGWYLFFFLIIIELSSYIMRAFSLAVRISANITAGHVLLALLFELKNFFIESILYCYLPFIIFFLSLILFLEFVCCFYTSLRIYYVILYLFKWFFTFS